MALPTSGSLSMSAINVELGRTSDTADTSLAGGVIPTSGSLFGLATGVIDKTAPHAISEFYGYTQSTGSTTTSTTSTTTTTGGTLLLDTYSGAGAAYSLRKLRAAYTGSAIRVQRSSDSTQQDIGFSGNFLDTSSLATFVGAGTGTVVTWYDQSLNGFDVTKGPAAAPTIRITGTDQSLNGKIAINFAGSQTLFRLTCTGVTAANLTYVAFGVASVNDTSTRLLFYLGGTAQYSQVMRRNGTILEAIATQTGFATFQDNGSLNPGTSQFIAATVRNTGSLEIFTNNQTNGATTAANSPSGAGGPHIIIGSFDPNAPSFTWNGKMQEVIMFALDPALNATLKDNVTTDLNSYYGAY
jgi:hypothetical protein